MFAFQMKPDGEKLVLPSGENLKEITPIVNGEKSRIRVHEELRIYPNDLHVVNVKFSGNNELFCTSKPSNVQIP